MNEAEFKRHLKDLAHGHHHPEEHDWDRAQPKAHPPKTGPAPRKKVSNRKSREK
jgi:hypothetical protein